MLRFTIWWHRNPRTYQAISKHPMLRFTTNEPIRDISSSAFQNILCYGLPVTMQKVDCPFSKHPMLRFTAIAQQRSGINFHISKHPMLRFTYISLHSVTIRTNFKTSYVTVYRRWSFRSPLEYFISKHPMLRFTDNASPFELQALSFQNILCYGLPFI